MSGNQGTRTKWQGSRFQKTLPLLAFLWVLVFAAFDGYSRWGLIQRASALTFSETVSENSEFQKIVLPPTSLDSRWWILHAEDLATNKEVIRVRETQRDNFPEGREVHWASLIPWLLTLSQNLFPQHSITEISLFFGPVSLIVGLALLWFLSIRFLRPEPAAFLILGLGISPVLYQAFRVGETDHHGLVALASALCVLALVQGMFPKHSGVSPSNASFQVWVSATSAAVGLWLSAASIVPLIGLLAGAACLALFLQKRGAGPICHWGLWRKWCFFGAGLSLVFYLLEYFPGHLSLRMEINNPVYALAWACTGQVIFQLGHQPKDPSLNSRLVFAVCLLGIFSPAWMILIFPGSFSLTDPFLSLLHNRHIVEFFPIASVLQLNPHWTVATQIFAWPVIFGFFLVNAYKTRGSAKSFPVFLLFAVIPAAGFFLLAMYQQRWLLNALALWLVLGALLWNSFRTRNMRVPLWLRLPAMLSGVLFFFVLPITDFQAAASSPSTIPKTWLQSIILRDVSQRLAGLEELRGQAVLSGPTSSTDLAYFSGLPVIGTFYWENRSGLKTAAQLFSEPDPARLLDLFIQTKVGAIVVPSWDSFGSKYEALLNPDAPAGQSFLNSVVKQQASLPQWLRPLHYPLPDALGLGGESLTIFLVLPKQTRSESLYFQGFYHLEVGDSVSAKSCFQEALKVNPFDRRSREILQRLEGMR